MKTLSEEMETITSISEAYEFVENNISHLESNHDVTDFWVAFRNKATDAQEKQLAQWELEFFLFNISGDKIFSFSYSTGEKPGDVYEYPVLDIHQTKAFDYLKLRAKNVHSPILKARFNHLLWKSCKGVKNRNYASKAIEEYINILNLYKDLNYIDSEDNTRVLIKKSESLASVVSETKLRASETVQIFRHLLLDVRNLKFYLKHSILEIMLKYPSVFTKGAFTDLLSIFDGDLQISESAKTDDFMMAKYYLPTGIKIASKHSCQVK